MWSDFLRKMSKMLNLCCLMLKCSKCYSLCCSTLSKYIKFSQCVLDTLYIIKYFWLGKTLMACIRAYIISLRNNVLFVSTFSQLREIEPVSGPAFTFGTDFSGSWPIKRVYSFVVNSYFMFISVQKVVLENFKYTVCSRVTT